ncbi:MAG: FHA domain-containing protein [Sarcina sp.]
MDLNKLMGFAFNIFFVIMLLLIIFYSLRIMSKDVEDKGKGKSKENKNKVDKPVNKVKSEPKKKVERPINKASTEEKRSYGLQVVATMTEGRLKVGTVIPMKNITTLGRKEDNSIILNDKFVSSNHARIYVKDNNIILEDLNSTNGTFVNEQKVSGKIRVGINDSIRLGSTIFKIIG